MPEIDQTPKTILDGILAVAKAVEANAVALMSASDALLEMMEHIKSADPFVGLSKQ